MPLLRQTCCVLFSLCALALTAAAQTDEQARDVQKLYQTAQVPGLEVTIYLQEENGSLTLVKPQHEFHLGERVRIRIESNFRGYLYIVNHGTSGKKTVIFPDGKESNRIQSGTSYLLPSSYGFTGDAGFETLQLIASPQRQPSLDAAIKQHDGLLNKTQIAAITRLWNDTAPEQAGISASASSVAGRSLRSAFDKERGTTTILTDDSRNPAFKRPSPKSKKSNSSATASVGIKLRNAGARR